MKPKNFPGRKLLRRIAAQPTCNHGAQELRNSNAIMQSRDMVDARAIRTKKYRAQENLL